MHFLVDHKDTHKNVTFNYIQSSKRWTVILASLSTFIYSIFLGTFLSIYFFLCVWYRGQKPTEMILSK